MVEPLLGAPVSRGVRALIPTVLLVMLAACGGAGTPERVPVSPDVASPSDAPWFEDGPAFERLGEAQAGEWRDRFPSDEPLDFEAYVDSDPVRADDGRRVLAFQPVGDFAADERAALDAAVAFTGIWFGLPVTTLEAVALPDDPEQSRVRNDMGGRRQFHTRWFLYELLPGRVPDDAVVLLGVTMGDLWPGRGWNFVFGQADLRRRVGVYSLARYFPGFFEDEETPDSARIGLRRTFQVVVHEAGHTFGLEHCVTWACAMNGSNSLAETDRAPMHLCPDCLRKLAWNRGFDIRRRHGRLAAALAAHGLDDDAAWHRDRAALGQ